MVVVDVNGIEICRRIRDHVTCPILFLTARVEDRDKLEGFAAGGDDYIVKPFSIDELGARVEAHLRREERSGKTSRRTLFDDHFMIDYTARTVSFKGKLICIEQDNGCGQLSNYADQFKIYGA